ncbi:hypothetical protein GCM10009001_34450 [Virgibacillus siamensis]|uniref:VOC domain-containing protein n=1 Tax=Virgibacillus siamensis TaxID=480071 RepID=A0ABN1GM03_9BACI
MKEKLQRVGTSYLPVTDVELSAKWYAGKLGAEVNYQDAEKAIVNFADQSFFLVKAGANQSANFYDADGQEHFSMTVEVNGMNALEAVRTELIQNGVKTGQIEDRGHPGKNFVFYDPDGNKFDVWSELNLEFKKLHNLERV